MNSDELKLNLCEDLSELEIKLLKEEIKSLASLEEGQINIHTLYVCEVNDFLESKIIIRSTVKKAVFLDKLALILSDKDGRILGQQLIELGFLGEIPSLSATPTTILLDKNNFLLEEVDLNNCKLLIGKDLKGIDSEKIKLNYVDDSLDEVNKRLFEKLVEEFPPIKINSFEIRYPRIIISEGKVSVPVIVFSGYNQEFNIHNLKIALQDNLNIVKAHKEIAELPVKVQPFTANVYNFIFEPNEIYSDIEDLKVCRISISN